MDTLFQDLRYAVRSLLRSPGLTATALLTLALGIGANTALFSLINGVFLSPPPGVEDADDLLWVSEVSAEYGGSAPIGITYPLFAELRGRQDLFAELAAFMTQSVDFAAGGDPQRLTAEVVSGEYFSVLRMRPVLGRGFLPEEDQTPDTHPVVVLGHDLWQNRFGSASDVVGRQVTINGAPFTVVGVAPAGFHGLRDMERPADLWVPSMTYRTVMPTREDPLGIDYGIRRFSAVGRLLPGVPRGRALAVMNGFLSGMAVEHPQAYEQVSAGIYDFRGIAGPLEFGGDAFVALFAGLITLIILLIACGNVANLLLARAASRRREIAIRAAVGASRWRIVRQLLVESVALAVTGGAAAILVASWMLDLFIALAPLTSPLPVALDGMTLLATFVLAIGTGIVTGLSPALRSSRADVTYDLKGTGSRAAARIRPQSALVVTQLALSSMLLVGAALMVRTMWELVRVDLRQPARDEVIAMTFDPRTQGYTEEAVRTLNELLLERAAAIPGVEAVTLTATVPHDVLSLHANRFVMEHEAESDRTTQFKPPLLRIIRPDFFRTIELPLRRGRDFTDEDRKETPPVGIVNETAAARYWPGEDPLGKRLRLGADTLPWLTVVGVAADARYDLGREGVTEPAIYTSELQRGPLGPEVTLLARGRGDALALVRPLRDAIGAVDPDLPVYRVRTLGQMLDERWSDGWVIGGLMVAVGALALLLALIGLHGVVAYTVEQRTREVGIRVALGASRREVLRLFAIGVLRVAGVGIGAGLLLAAGLAALMGSLVAGLRTLDVVSFVAVATILLAVTLLASYFPARRALRVDAMVALRAE
jgi:predicted permease